jgi:ribosome-associated protein
VQKGVNTLHRRIPEDHLTFTFARSSGPGGQNVNKTSTRATLWFDLVGSHILSHEEKRRIRARLGGRINKAGHLRVVSMRHRTQLENRRAATERFYRLLAEALRRRKVRKPTNVPAGTRRQRLKDKRLRGELKRLRSGRSIDQGDG